MPLTAVALDLQGSNGGCPHSAHQVDGARCSVFESLPSPVPSSGTTSHQSAVGTPGSSGGRLATPRSARATSPSCSRGAWGCSSAAQLENTARPQAGGDAGQQPASPCDEASAGPGHGCSHAAPSLLAKSCQLVCTAAAPQLPAGQTEHRTRAIPVKRHRLTISFPSEAVGTSDHLSGWRSITDMSPPKILRAQDRTQPGAARWLWNSPVGHRRAGRRRRRGSRVWSAAGQGPGRKGRITANAALTAASVLPACCAQAAP